MSATNEERQIALDCRDQILKDHFDDITSNAIWGCSGNGAWILVHLDLPNDSVTKSKIARFLGSLSARYSNPKVIIDTNTANPNRHLAIPGTIKCKGEHNELTPWRVVTIDGGLLPEWRQSALAKNN